MALFEIFMLFLFVVSGGILFNDRFKRNWFAIACAASIAMVSTYYLTRQIVHEVFLEEMAKVDQTSGVEPAPAPRSSPPQLEPQKTMPSVPETVRDITRQSVEDVFQGYLRAWQDGDIQTQDKLLDESFSYIDQDNKRQYKSAYLAKKKQLAARYGASSTNSNITIDATNVEIEVKEQVGTVTYDQSYHSPYYSSTGRNKFVVRQFSDGVRIVEEVFQRSSYTTNPEK